MKISATELANESKAVLDRVIHRGQTIVVQRHGRDVAEIRPRVGVSSREFSARLREAAFHKQDTAELKQAISEAAAVFGYAGGD